MNELLLELAKQIPNAVAVILMAYLFLSAEKGREERRVANAKEMEIERRNHETAMNNMWASYIKSILDQQNATYQALMDTINDHEKESQRRYERMGITKDLIDAVKERAAK